MKRKHLILPAKPKIGPPPPAPSPHGDNGRAANGKFAKGNAIGRGNPLAGRVHEFRVLLMGELTPKRFKKVVRRLIGLALNGEGITAIAAIKIILERGIGRVKVDETLDDDVYDADEKYL